MPITLDDSLSLSGVLGISQQYLIFTVWIVIGFAIFSTARYFQSPWRKLPPGPRGLLLGNILQLRGPQWFTFVKWSQQFGDIFYLKAMGQPIVVLNTQKAAVDLLNRRAGIYSDRPRNIVAAEILSGGLVITLQNYGPLWRRMRKAVHEGLNKSSEAPQLDEAILLTSGLLAQPAMWDKHIRRKTASLAMSITYDTPPIVSEQDSGVKAIDDFMTRLTPRASLPGAHLVEFLPWMMHIPSRWGILWTKERIDYKFTTITLQLKGIDSPSLAGNWITDADRYGLSEREGAWLAGLTYAGGSDTSAVARAWWMLAMRRAQAELDSVVGRTRIPTFSDFQHLPYIRAMVKEILRWRSLDPLGLPHRSTEDDRYNGMFLDVNGEVAPCPADTKEEGHVSYGFGRRICPGRHFSNNSLFIDIAMVLWGCNIEPGKDEHGNVIPIDVDGWVDDGVLVRPVPFKAVISPRFPEAVTLLAGERELRDR
ncbi:cytochrome P450 [Lactarius sanguifluus]|nr:cytochrome P450 [Lactarius sanguifluus]